MWGAIPATCASTSLPSARLVMSFLPGAVQCGEQVERDPAERHVDPEPRGQDDEVAVDAVELQPASAASVFEHGDPDVGGTVCRQRLAVRAYEPQAVLRRRTGDPRHRKEAGAIGDRRA